MKLRRAFAFIVLAAIPSLLACRPHGTPVAAAPSAVSIEIPRPEYLNDCDVPSVMLRLGEQRRVDFECAGNLNEDQFAWKNSNQANSARITLDDNENIRTGPCGAVFALSFSLPNAHGELKSQPGKRCGEMRRYCVRLQRPSTPGVLEPWKVTLDSPRCGTGD